MSTGCCTAQAVMATVAAMERAAVKSSFFIAHSKNSLLVVRFGCLRLGLKTRGKTNGVFWAHGSTPTAVGALARGNEASLSRELEIEYMGFGTHTQTVTAFGAAFVVKDGFDDANFADNGPEGAERTQMTAPAAFKKQKIQRKDARDGRDKSRSDAPDKFAPQESLRTYPFKGGGAADWRAVKLQPGKLFVVGDPKQSIYRFRGADITAYELFTDLILKQGGEKAYLRQNFRSEKEIIALANGVCAAVMREKPAFQPAYEAIFTEKTDTYGAAEMALVCAGEEKVSADDYRHNQGRFIARWIRDSVGKMTLRSGRKLQYKDIALLSRAATTLGPYADALRREGVPFSLEEDRDFYRRQEISDFLNFLRAADDPRNRIALAGVLRSPLGALTDEELYRLARAGELDWRADTHEPKARRVFALLKNFAARAGREPLRDLLRGLLNETFLAEACTAAYDGERSMANLQKLVSLAEGYSLQTPSTLGQFLSRVQEMMEQELGRLTALPEGEALDAVSVMTVHKSKGLEFPVVILADISKKESACAFVFLAL